MNGQRYTCEQSPAGRHYVADIEARQLAAGPFPTVEQCAYECDRLREPVYHNGQARPAWHDLPDYVRANWRQNPTPRDWRAVALARADSLAAE